MKNCQKLVLVIFLIGLSGCAEQSTITHVPRTVVTMGLDLRPYTEEGILITPYKYLADYKSVGFLTTVIYPEANLKQIDTGKKNIRTHKKVFRDEWIIEKISADEAISDMVQTAQSMGADAIVELKIVHIEQPQRDTNPALMRQGFEISGFAIKRLGAFNKQKKSPEQMDEQTE